MDLFVVTDTKGSGRLVGVFDTPAAAQALLEINPHYFRVRRCTLNGVDPAVLPWALDDAERERLAARIAGGP